MKNILLALLVLTGSTLFGQASNRLIVGLLLLEETQGHVYDGYFLPNIESRRLKAKNAIDTIQGYTVEFIYGCVPDNHALRNDLRRKKALDSVQAISTFVSSKGQKFLDSTKIYFANGAFGRFDLTDQGKTIRYQQFQINGKILVLAIKGECTARSFLSRKGIVPS
jgi:hypothetical protein